MSGIEVMMELGLSFCEGVAGELPEDTEKKLRSAFKEYISEKISFHSCCTKVIDLIGKDDPVHRLREILELPEEPLPYRDDLDSDDGSLSNSRKKTRTWSINEDQRLLAGIFHYGLDNWQAVAQFLGSGRNRAQCSQRWTRGLNPRISKKSWTPEENQQLMNLVKIHGQKSWTKIASIMGNRSDVQCRYHYKQILTGKQDSNPASSSEQMPLPLKRNSKLTMSSDSLVLPKKRLDEMSPSPLGCVPTIPTNDRILLSQSSFSVSMPSFRLAESSPLSEENAFVQPIPIVPRKSTFNPIKPNRIATCNWGTCGVGPQELDGFLSHFMY